MSSRFPITGFLVVLAAMGLGMVAPLSTARASDAGKVLAAIAAGVLVYEVVDDISDRHHGRDCHRGWSSGPDYYYRSNACGRTRSAYNHGYRDGFSDGRQVGRHEGYHRGYRDGRQDQWIADRHAHGYRSRPVSVGPRPCF